MILMTAMMEAIMMMETKEEKEEIAMMMTAQEEVKIMIDPEKEKEAEAGAGMLDQEGADLEAEIQDALQLYQKCQLQMPKIIIGLVTLLSFGTTLRNGENCWTPPTTPLHKQ